MAMCLKCGTKAKLRKNKEGKYYFCDHHGFVRDVEPAYKMVTKFEEDNEKQ